MSKKKLTKDWVGNYLKSHPSFLSDFVVKHVPPQTLQEWRKEKEAMKSKEGGVVSGAVKTIQKLSNVHGLPDLAIAEVGQRKTISDLKEFIEDPTKKESRQLQRKKTITELTEVQQEDLFFELIIDIANELAVDALCMKILSNVGMLTGSDRCSLFLVRVNGRGDQFLESKLFESSDPAGRICTPMQEGGISVQIPFGKGIAGMVAQTKKPINVVDAHKDERFNTEIDKKTGYVTKSLLTMPIFNFEGTVIGVAQIMNKQGGNAPFNRQDEKIFEKFLVFCGISLTNAELFGLSLSEFKMNKLLLVLAKGIFAEQTKLDSLARRIMLDIHSIISCDRCIMYLVNFTHSAEQDIEITKAFDLTVSDKTILNPSDDALRKFPPTNFALQVSRTGETHEFDAKSEGVKPLRSDSGYEIRSVLSMPVLDMHKNVIGVVQLINKFHDEEFNPSDMKTIATFALFCGLGICNCRLYESMVKMMARQKVNLDVLSYFAAASDSETEDLMKSAVLKSQKLKLTSLDFFESSLSDSETSKAIITIFTELNLIEHFRIQTDILCRWILSIKKNYRPHPYHNWRHAVNVVQMMFYCLTVGELRSVLSELEKLALIVAALCHDLDYRPEISRGPNRPQSLQTMYSLQSGEHHYADQCIMLLNNEKTNVFHSLASDEYKVILELLESCILSADLNDFTKNIRAFQDLVPKEKVSWTVDYNRRVLRTVLMVACDVCITCKPWSTQQKVAQVVFTEFVRLSEEGKPKTGKSLSIQKRIRSELPKMQVVFFDVVSIPLYSLLSAAFPLLKPAYEACLANRTQWKKLAEDALKSAK